MISIDFSLFLTSPFQYSDLSTCLLLLQCLKQAFLTEASLRELALASLPQVTLKRKRVHPLQGIFQGVQVIKFLSFWNTHPGALLRLQHHDDNFMPGGRAGAAVYGSKWRGGCQRNPTRADSECLTYSSSLMNGDQCCLAAR